MGPQGAKKALADGMAGAGHPERSQRRLAQGTGHSACGRFRSSEVSQRRFTLFKQ